MRQKLILLTVLLAALSAFSAEYFVDASRPNDTGIATNWATAKKTIQAAVGLTVDGDTVWVTNGTYSVGGAVAPGYSLTNRVCITNAITVRSVNGPEMTFIDGASSARGVYMFNGSVLSGFTITNGTTRGVTLATGNNAPDKDNNGGGIYAENSACVITNCIISGNVTANGILNTLYFSHPGGCSGYGGGVYGGTLVRCVLIGNKTGNGQSGSYSEYGNGYNGGSAGHGGGAYGSALMQCLLVNNATGNGGSGSSGDTGGNGGNGGSGGGAYNSVMTQCTLNGNVTGSGGAAGYSYVFGSTPSPGINGYGTGTCGGSLQNCIVWGNASKDVQNASSVYYSCAGNAPTGNGNIKTNPLFVDAANGDFRLQTNSPCINAGNNAYAPAGTDLAGNPRIIGGTVDMGAYEFYAEQDDYDSDGIPNGWAAEHFGGITRADANAVCSNGVNSILQAYIAGLDPNDPDSKFLTSVLPGSILQWTPCTSGRVYSIQWSTNLLDGFQPLETNILWTAGCFTDAVHNASGHLFYKLDVRLEE